MSVCTHSLVVKHHFSFTSWLPCCCIFRYLSHSRMPVDSILEAMFTVFPNRQYRGMVRPTTPATHDPETHSVSGKDESWDQDMGLFPCFKAWLCCLSGPLTRLYRLLTRVKSDSNAYWNIRHVSHLEGADSAQDVQRHVGDLSSMSVTVGNRNSRCHHVSISNCFHLNIRGVS